MNLQKRTCVISLSDLHKFHKLDQSILFTGHREILNAYYRHLFHMVKFVVYSKVFNRPEKFKFLKILRAQMTDEEQTLLFFNWRSGYGKEWENEENKFFTEYKMIHNIELKDFQYSKEGKIYNSENDLYKEFPNLAEENRDKMFEFVERNKKRNG
ncbi:MAG: putative phage abortive infection protein [Bacteroidales bacterium]|nr:putative phage abortive infection protein [Bacteroidales bacterium]